MRHVKTVAAYRDRYQVTADTLLGSRPEHTAQGVDVARASFARRRAPNEIAEPVRAAGDDAGDAAGSRKPTQQSARLST